MLARIAALALFASIASAQTTERISQFVGGSYLGISGSSMSGDGELVAFPAQTTTVGGPQGIYLWRRSTGVTVLVETGYARLVKIARDGGFIVWTTAFDSLSNGEVYRHDLGTGTTEVVSVDAGGSPLGGSSSEPDVSADGRFVAFLSKEPGSAPGHPGAGVRHVIVRDMLLGVSELVDVRPNGVPANGPSEWVSVSDDGDVLAFRSFATNLAQDETPNSWNSYVRRRAANTTDVIPSGGSYSDPDVSADGRFVAFETALAYAGNDQNDAIDVYVLDLDTDTFAVASIDPISGAPGNGIRPALSPHGRYVVFSGDMQVAPGQVASGLWRRDVVLGTTEFLTFNVNGGLAGGFAYGKAEVSDDGRYVAFTWTSALVPGDQNGLPDVYVRDLGEQRIGDPFCAPANVNSTGAAGRALATGSTALTDDAFALTATSLPPNQFGYFILSRTLTITPLAGGSQGDLCLLGTIGRLTAQTMSSGSGGALHVVVDLDALPTPLQPAVLSGETWGFQCWYRDVNPQPTSNFTDAVVVTFQ